MIRKKAARLAALALCLLGLAACGQDAAQSGASEASGTQAEPVTAAESEAAPTETEKAMETAETAAPAEAGASSEEAQPEETQAEKELAAPSVTGPLHVEGTRLCGSDGAPVQLKGISTHGLAWFPEYVNAPCFQELRQEWGANVVRLAMYTAESGGYCTDGDREALKQLVLDGVACAAEADMYVILDWHILSDGDPNTYREEAVEFFREMSAALADQDHVLYEICNEPNGNTAWQDIKDYAQAVIPAIRDNDPDAVIIVGTPNWSQYVDQAAADPIEGETNLMYALHFYAATHGQSLRDTMTAAVEAGLPVFVTEYGICDASGSGGINTAEAAAWVQTMDEYGVSYVAWNLSNKQETSAMLRSGCGKTSGFAVEDLSDSGKWVRDMLSGTLPEETQETAVTAASGAFLWSAELDGSWESEGRYFCLYRVTVTNDTGRACEDWSIDLTFDREVALSDSWNGSFTVEGNTVHVSAADYNGTLAPGASAQDVGLIVSGETAPSLEP